MRMVKIFEQAKYKQMAPFVQQEIRDLAAAAQVCLPSGDDEVLCLMQHERLLAFAAWRSVLDEAELLSIAVQVQQRRQGLAAILLEGMMRIWLNGGIEKAFLEVRASNQAARALYAKHGFAQVAIRRNYYPLPAQSTLREDAIVMSKEMRN